MRKILGSTGLFLFLIGMSSMDYSILIAIVSMITGALLIIPYYREDKRIEKKRNNYRSKYRDYNWDEI